MKITQISPQFNCIVCKNHDRYHTNSTGVWNFLKCNCGAEYTLIKTNTKQDISFNENHYKVIAFHYKANKYSVFLESGQASTKINNNYYGNIQDIFTKKSLIKILSDMDKSIIFKK